MNSDPQSPTPGAALGLNDVLFTVFRHKWKILTFILLGAAAAAALMFFTKPQYTSNAKLLVRYVTETRGPDAAQGDVVREPDRMGATIINSEIEILTSSDAISAVARTVGPARILAAYGGGTNEAAAADVLAGGLKVDPGRNTSVITVSLTHRDPLVAQSALSALREQYLDRHNRFHRSGNSFNFLSEQTTEIRGRLTQIENDLQRRKNDLNVTSIEDAKKDLFLQLSGLRKLINESEADLAQQQAQLALYTGRPVVAAVNDNAANDTNVANVDLVQTNAVVEVASAISPTNAAAPAPVGATQLATYRRLAEQLERLKTRELDLQQTYSDENRLLKRTREEIVALEQRIEELGIDPAALAPTLQASNSSVASAFNAADLDRNIRSLHAKLAALKSQEDRLIEDIRKINNGESVIVALERQKTLTEDLYLYFSKSLERARIDQSLSEGRRNNISVIQDPTFGTPASGNVLKKAGMAFAAVSGIGFAWAFALDFLLNPAFKRRKEVESVLRLPVFASIPDFGRNGHSRLRLKNSKKNSDQDSALITNGGEIPPWDESDPMLPYYEAVRDRLVMSYEGDTHKPKIVGLTTDHSGAGVTRLATGVAAALSRDVERKVLLIALAKNSVAVSSFEKGRPSVEFAPGYSNAVDADTDALQHPNSDSVAQNLYSLAKTGRNLAGASVVQSFCDLIPKLRNAPYDYIIFDLPPLSETSGSLRLASHMERTLLVVEAERSSKEQLKRARELLAESGTFMSAIFNRAQSVVPKFLKTEV